MAAATPPHLGPMQASPRAPFHGRDRGTTVQLGSSVSRRRNDVPGGISKTGDAGNLGEVSAQKTSVDAADGGTGDRESGTSHGLENRDENFAASHADRLGSVDSPDMGGLYRANGKFSSETDRAPDPEYGLSVGDPSHKQMDPQGLDPDIEIGLTTARGKIDALNTADAQELPDSADVDGDRICRVCHVGLYAPGTGEPMELACACKQDLALCHRQCAEEWFKVRGNRTCEICGQTVQNLATELGTSTEAASGSEARLDHVVAIGINAPPVSRMRRFRQVFWQRKAVRNFLLATLVAIFMIPWFFRIAYYTS